MPKNHVLKCRVTKTQLEEIKNKAKVKGYVTLAAYLRDLTSQRNDLIESKIIEINKIVRELLEAIPWKK